MTDPPRACVVGAGLGGIAAAAHLKRAGIPFTLFEASGGPGGTWWDNRYPGSACDVASHFYSYSFRPYDWPTTHASQPEIQRYVEHVLDAEDLRPHLRFGTRVVRATWDTERCLYAVETDAGDRLDCELLICATGLLNQPRYPDWPGLADFAGPAFHTARWEPQHDLSGRTVAVVGTGSTAAQVVPALAPTVGQLILFAREPAWVIPKDDRPLGRRERARLRRAAARRLERTRLFLRTEGLALAARPGSLMYRHAESRCRRYRERVLAGRPDLLAQLTPDYPFQCKRPVISSDFYPALLRDNVTVVPSSVSRVTAGGLVDAAGAEHAADAIVMATGFQPWNFLWSLEVVGRAGRALHDVWRDAPAAYLGVMVAGFPNFFMLYGPNSNVGCITAVLERHVEFAMRAVRRMRRRGGRTVDVPAGLVERFNRALDGKNDKRTWEGACSNYYHAASGRNVTQWPWTSTVYWAALRLGHRLLRVG